MKGLSELTEGGAERVTRVQMVGLSERENEFAIE